MRKIIALAVIIVIAAVAVVWSKSLFGPGKMVGELEATEASATASPMEIMVRHGKNAPVERWHPPF